MSDVSILSELIDPKVLARKADVASVQLEEKAAEHSVLVSELPQDCFVIEADKACRTAFIEGVFCCRHNECKMADYIIISPSSRRIVYVELKGSKRNAGKHVVWQLTGAFCFGRYLREVGRRFWQTDSFLDGYDHHYAVVFKSSAKIPTHKLQRDVGRRHDKPDKYMKITGMEELTFANLAGLPTAQNA